MVLKPHGFPAMAGLVRVSAWGLFFCAHLVLEMEEEC